MLYFSLTLMGLSYALVGWFLAAHHIIWYLGIFVAIIAIILAWSSNRFVRGWWADLLQSLILTLMGSLLLIFLFISSAFPILVVLPILTTFLTWLEMQSLNLKLAQMIGIIAGIAAFALGVGEGIDLIALPSDRY